MSIQDIWKKVFIMPKKLYLAIAVVIKIIFLILFTSEYSLNLFQPFVLTFISKDINPWQYYYENNLDLNAFPYHSLMLFILYPFAKLASFLSMPFIFKIPLLIADISIFFILKKLFPNKEKNIFIFYFTNPIIIYAIYIHSQLDIIPTALLMHSIYLLTKKNIIYSAISLGLALATKTHVLVALPLIFFYLIKVEKIKTAIKYSLISLIIPIVLDLSFLFSDGFIKMVILNSKQLLLFDSYYIIGEVKILFPIAALLIVYFHFFNQDKVNNDLLYLYFGLLFTAIIFFIYPAPAWYVWMVPFISIYFIQNNNYKNFILYYVLSISYIFFFLFAYKSEYKDILFLGKEINLKISSEKTINFLFTFLEVVLLMTMYVFYKYGIKSNSIYKKITNLVIGVGGDSGVGKTSFIENLKSILGENLLIIEGDGEHKWERGNENWNKYTHLDPKANLIHKQADIIYALKNNNVVYRREYDHSSGKFTEPRRVEPKKYIAIVGLHPFYLPKLRKIIDFKIYIDTEEVLRRHWKIIRDIKKRGYSKQKVLEQIERRMSDAKKYIYPQKKFADLVIKYYNINQFTLGNEHENIKLGLKVVIDASIHLEDLLDRLDVDYIWDYNDDLKTQYIILEKEPSVDFKDISIDIIENINEIISIQPIWKDGYEGFIQIISIKIISEKLKEVSK